MRGGYGTSLSSSASDAAKKMKGGSLSDAIDAFDSAVALAKTAGNNTQLRRVASDALNFVRKSDKTTDYMKKNVLPRMQEEFTEAFGDDMTESGQALREVSAYRLGKKFGASAVKAATGVGRKASGAARTETVRRGGKSVSVRRDIGGAGGGQFVNALTSMRQSMSSSLRLARRAKRMRSDSTVYQSDGSSQERMDALRDRVMARMAGGRKLSAKERAARGRIRAAEQRRRAEERAKQPPAPKPAARPAEPPKPAETPRPSPAQRRRTPTSTTPDSVPGRTGGAISRTPDLWKPSDILVFDGNGWRKYRDAINVRSAREVGRILDELGLAIPPSAYSGQTNPKVALGTYGISARVDDGGFQGKYRANDFESGIILSPSVQDGKAALLHEFGHFLDYEGLQPEDGWEIHSPFTESGNLSIEKVLSAVRNSEGYAELLFQSPDNLEEYWSQREEQFARAFAQWAVLRSNGDMGEFLRSAFIKRSNGLAFNHQWRSADDFSPIADALDELFVEAGWLQ